jgi:hypothetical protein
VGVAREKEFENGGLKRDQKSPVMARGARKAAQDLLRVGAPLQMHSEELE